MKYSYRGVKYNHVSPSLEVTETEIIGHYRGTPCRRRHFATTDLNQPTHSMKYRGVEYGSKVNTEVLNERIQAISPKVPDVVPKSLSARSYIKYTMPSNRLGAQDASELEKVHNTFIRQTLERRLGVAKRNGNQSLIQMLEQEQHQLN